MRVSYDKQVDAAYLYLNNEIADTQVVRSEEGIPGVVCDYDDHNNLIGIEITSIRFRSFESMQFVTSLLSEEQKRQFREFYGQTPA